jgi:uncharacterized protein DUF6636
MRLRAVAAGLVAAVCLGGCGTASDLVGAESSPSGPERPAETTDPTTPSPSDSPTPSTAPTEDSDGQPLKQLPHVVGEMDYFASPSHNIGCAITDSMVRCDIREKSYREPAQPASCSLDYGQSLAVGPDGPAQFACVGDTVLGSHQILPYNSSTEVGDYGCTSRETGMTCYNLSTRHGFLISREIVNVF